MIIPQKCISGQCAGIVAEINRIIPAISKHVIAQEALSGRSKRIGIEESTCFGVVITALEVIESNFVGLHIAGRGGFGPAWRVKPYAENHPGFPEGMPPYGRLGIRD